MSFNRLPYDACTYEHDLRQSVGVGAYVFATPTPECVGCFEVSQCGPDGSALVDVHSELRGITRKASRCPARVMSTMPKCKTTRLANCRSILDEHTRLSNPPCTLRGSGINRFQWLCADPQRLAERPFEAERSNRLLVKDGYRMEVDTPLDATGALPPGGAPPVSLHAPSCAASEPTHPPFNTVWRGCAAYAS
jgi:hypothetical protein